MTTQTQPGMKTALPVQGGTAQPPSTDPFSSAAYAQGQASLSNTNQQTVANRSDQTNPFGSSQWTMDPTTGQWSQNVSLSGQQGQSLGSQQDIQAQRLGGADSMVPGAVSNLQNPIDTSGFAGLFSFGAPGQTNQRAQDAVMGQLQPLMDQRRSRAENQLANQGITQGSEAYGHAEDQLGRDDNNARLQAIMAGFQQGNAENTQNINYGNYEQGQRGYQLGEAQTLRDQPLADINALVSGQGVQAPTFGQYGQAGVAQTPNYLGAQQSNYNSQLDVQNANADSKASFNNGLFGLGGAFINSPIGQKAIGTGGDYLQNLFGFGPG